MKHPKPSFTDPGSGISSREVEAHETFREHRGISIDGESIAKAFVCALLIVFFSLVQTTLFTKFRPFGAVPDLILPLVVAIAMTEHERWGAIIGVIAAVVIESIGGSTVTLLPLLYMPAGCICGLLTVYVFRDAIAVRGLYTIVTSVLRGILTLIALLVTVDGISLLTCLTAVILPEFAANVVFAAIPHITAKLALRPFHLTREERVTRSEK